VKIAIDLDGVCYEWDRTARYMLREYRNLSHVPVLQHPSRIGIASSEPLIRLTGSGCGLRA